MARRYFGTDGVRGVVGSDLTADLVERLGRAATHWSRLEDVLAERDINRSKKVLVGRDTRGSGPELERALARGIASADGTALLGGVLPTPAVALLAEELGVVVSASHNPPEYNGVKLFDRDGRKLAEYDEEAIEGLLDSLPDGSGSVEHIEGMGARYLEHVLERFGKNLSGLRIGVDCANGAFFELAPRALAELGADVVAIGVEPDGSNINVGCGATDLVALSHKVLEADCDLGVAFDGDGDRMLAVDERGESVDGDQILGILAPALDVDLVAVTVMTNLGFHQLMKDRGIRVVTTPVGDRHVLQALRREGGVLGGEQSGHIVWLRDHVTGDGLVAALLVCGALGGRPLSEAAATMTRYPQAKVNVRVSHRLAAGELPQAVRDEAERLNAELGEHGRVLVRSSGTEPVVRVLAEAETEEEAERVSATIARLVVEELG